MAICCLCGRIIPIGKGNNPEPVKDWSAGVCCDECNARIVIPMRIKEMETAELGQLY